MRRLVLKIPVLLFVFLASALIFSSVFNTGQTVSTTDLASAALPMLYMKNSDMLINPMRGYTVKMQEDTLRESVTPVSTKRELTVVIEPQGEKVQEISYTVTQPGSLEVIEERRVSLTNEVDGQISIDFTLQEPILMNQEYYLRFNLVMSDGTTVYYYTRLLQRSGLNSSQYLEFVKNFYEKCVNKSAASSLTTYLESDSSSDDGDLSYVNINSSFDSVTWGDLSPQIEKKAVPVISEINETTCSITMFYIISAYTEDDELEYYQVSEFYRMRYASSRVMLLNFERNTEQYFDSNILATGDYGLNLGILSGDGEIVTDANADIAAFVQGGELYTFNSDASRISRIFSFRTSDAFDMREMDSHHAIKVIRVTEGGNVDFLVYGYMCSDRYEGQNGILVYHYDSQLNVTREELFIPCDVSYEYLQRDLESITYISADSLFYILINGTLYKVNLTDGSNEILLENVNVKCIAASSTQKTLAWMEEMEPSASRTITMMDLDTGAKHSITAPSGCYIRILGFLNEDLVYGVASQDEIVSTTFAMKTVRIEDFNGNLVKEYSKENIWVTDASVSSESIELYRVKLNSDGKYVNTETDKIINNIEVSSDHVLYKKRSDAEKGQIAWLYFDKKISSSIPVIIETKYSTFAADQRLKISFEGCQDGMYMVYAWGRLQDILPNARAAVALADEEMGVVLNASQQYIWERGNQQTTRRINLDELPEGMLTVPDTAEKFTQILGDDYTILELAGCTLSEVLYMVSEGQAVAAKTADGYVLIVGYDYYNVILYDTTRKETYYGGLNDSTAMFEAAGNVFISYIENLY